MALIDEIRAARQAHEELRSSAPAGANLDPKADRYLAVKAALDHAWEAADQPGAAASAGDVRWAVRRLTGDAEYHAGLSDVEGYRDPAEARAAYGLLERTFAR